MRKTCNFTLIYVTTMSIKRFFFPFYRRERLIDVKWVDFFLVGVSLARSFKNIAFDFLIQRLVCEILNF